MSVKQPSIKKNFLMNAILTMSSFIFPLITFPYVSRILLPIGTGKVQFATSLIGYFNMFAQLGIPTYGVRAIAKVRDNKEEMTRVTHELLIINIVMSILSYIALAIALFTIPRLQEERLLYVIISSNILLSAIGMEWMYRGLEQYSYITKRSLTFKVIAMIAMFSLIHTKEDYIIYGAISVFAAAGSSILNFINARKYIYLKPMGDYNFRRHLHAVGVFFAMACATQVYTHLDTVMLGFMVDDTEVGLYNAAVKVKTIMVSVVTSLGTVLLPRASYYIQNNLMDEFKKISGKALNFIFLAAIPLTIYFILFANNTIYLVSGPAYTGSIVPMQIIMPTLFFIGITNIFGIQMLVPLGKEKVVLHSEIAGAIVDLIVNYLLIPKIGSAGAAIGTLIAEFVVLLWQYVALRDMFDHIFQGIHFGKIGIALGLSTIVLVGLRFIPIPGNFLTILISGSIYFTLYFIILLILKEDLATYIFETLKNQAMKLKQKSQ